MTMMKMFTVAAETDFDGLAKTLLDGRLDAGRAEAALRQLKDFNPHLTSKKLRAGTMVFVPDHPGFKATASASSPTSAFEDFAALAAEGLHNAARSFKSGGAERAAERREVLKALQSGTVKRAIEEDKEIAGQAEDAAKDLSNDESEEKDDQDSFASMRDAAISALAEIAKRFN
jgi:hypothetical protein